MRKMSWLLAILLAVSAGFTVRAADSAPKKDDAKKEETKKADAAAAGAQQTLTGDLALNADGRPVLRLKDERPVKTYILYADGDVAKTLSDLAKKHAHADVTGVLAPDQVSVKVASVTEDKKKDGKQGGGGHGGGGRH